jgi:hypothetical protein
MKIKAALKTHADFIVLAITPIDTGLVAWRVMAGRLLSSKSTSSGISLSQPMGSRTDPGSSNGFGASMPADDGFSRITVLRQTTNDQLQ